MIEKWKRRNLTLRGRVAISKSLLLSQFVYLLTILPTPSAEGSRLSSTTTSLVTPKGSGLESMYTRKSLGGLGFIRITTFVHGLKCAWMKRYMCGEKDHWVHILDMRFGVTEESRGKVTPMGTNNSWKWLALNSDAQ
jgi:hypothetical protein